MTSGLNSQKIKNKKFLKGWYACKSEVEQGFGLRGKYIYIYICMYVYMTHNFAYHEYIVFETNLKNEKLFIWILMIF